MKRAIDILICLLAMPLALPISLLLVGLIRLDSRGPGLFVQVRLGRNQEPFRMLKLRTMAAGTDNLPSHEISGNRITRLGKVLRHLKLDELPQFLNVLTGSMSLVGPRPCLPSQQQLIEAREALGVFAFRPGITGPAQLLGIDMVTPSRLASVEAEYFDRADAWDDLKLIFSTLLGSGRGDAALGSKDR